MFCKLKSVVVLFNIVTTVQLRNSILLLLWSTDMSLLTVDGCNSYTVLSEADRAQGYRVTNASNYRYDNNDLVSGWYRFQRAAGDRMADRCVPMNHCGTQVPTWLNGTHPTIAEGVVIRRICYHYSNKCCDWHQIIRIKNCGAYFVYDLSRTYYYYARYCGNRMAGKFLRMFLIISVSSQNIKLQ